MTVEAVRARSKSQRTLPIRPAIENAENGHAFAANYEGDGYAALEADNAKPRSDIVATLAPLGSVVEAAAKRADALFISGCSDDTAAGFRDGIIYPIEVASCFFGLGDSPLFHLPARRRSS